MFRVQIHTYFLLFIATCLLSCGEKEGHRLTLFLTQQDIEKLEKTTDPAHVQYKYFKELQQYADRCIKQGVQLPDRGGNWYHYYVDPEEGQRLITGKQIAPFKWEHYTADCTVVYLGDPGIPAKDYDGVVISSKAHGHYSSATFGAALMYRLTGEKKYLDFLIEIMDQYCIKYPEYPYRNIKHKPDFYTGTGCGKAKVQALDESVWLIRILQGLDLVWGKLPKAKKQSIEENILNPAMYSITKNKPGIHNIQCWNNAAIGLTGYLTGNDTLINLAINDPKTGFNVNLQEGLTPEGFWYERSPSYHFYSIEPIHFLAEAMKNQGDQELSPRIKKLFDAPILFSPPNGDMPRLNDARPIYLPDFKRLYFYAYSRFKDPSYLKICASTSSSSNTTFNYEWFFSEGEIENQPLLLDCKTASYPGTGYDILNRKNLWVLVKYDNHTGGHAHPDAMSFVTWYNGDYTAIDPGIAEYGALAHRNWYKRTLAHNTLTINGENQALKGGKLINTGIEKEVPFSQVKSDEIYPGVVYFRTICLPSDSIVLIADVIRSEEPKDMELAYHTRGVFSSEPGGSSLTLKNEFPYSFIRNPRGLLPNRSFQFSINNPDFKAKQNISILSNQEIELIYGSGPGYDFEETPLILLRHSGNRWRVVWLIAYDKEELGIKLMGENIEIVSKEDESTIASFLINPENGEFEVL